MIDKAVLDAQLVHLRSRWEKASAYLGEIAGKAIATDPTEQHQDKIKGLARSINQDLDRFDEAFENLRRETVQYLENAAAYRQSLYSKDNPPF